MGFHVLVLEFNKKYFEISDYRNRTLLKGKERKGKQKTVTRDGINRAVMTSSVIDQSEILSVQTLFEHVDGISRDY